MNGLALAVLALAAAVLLAWALACDSGDDDDNDAQTTDDDTGGADDDNDTSGDDDNDDNDDDTASYTCQQVDGGLNDICDRPLLSLDATWEEWCGLSSELFGGAMSPYFLCIADCAFVQDCSEPCFTGCDSPEDPGGDGCDHTVHGIYVCGVAFLYDSDPDYYWIPEMDAAAACTGSMSNEPWSCYGHCAASASCSDPPTPDETQALIDCMNACR
jgi:hypothetical protein